MKKLLILFYMLFAWEVAGFATADSSNLVPLDVNGFIHDALTGTAVSMHKVYLLSDDFSTVNVFDSTLTDGNGFYYFTVFVPDTILYFLQVYTYDCMNVKHDSNVNFPPYWFQVDFTICDSIPASCEASFSFAPDPLNSYKLQFTDNSTGNINEWQWDFGDGNTSTLQNPVHIYNSAGNFYVSLIASDSIPNPYCYSIDSQLVVIVYYPMFNLGGQVFAGVFPQSIGQVVLYKTAALEYPALDTATLNQNGVYYFYQVPAGDYVVKAFSPDSPGIGQRYFPSYSPQGILWQTASTIHLSQNLFYADITLTPIQYVATGAGNVTGDVSMTTATSPLPLPNVEVLLLDSLMQALDYTITGPDGSYIFYGIHPGVHYVRPEIPGKVCEALSFQAGGSFPDTATVHLLVPGSVIGIDEPGLLYHASEVFPNPAHMGSAIELDLLKPANGNLQIYDITGRIVSQSQIHLGRGANTQTLPLESLHNGMYFLNIQLLGIKPLNRKFLLCND